MGFEVIEKEAQLINLSKDDFITKETLLGKGSIIINLVTLKINYIRTEEAPNLDEYDKVFSAGKETANLSDIDFINNLKRHEDCYLITMFESMLSYYLNRMLNNIGGLKIKIDGLFSDYEELISISKDMDAKKDYRLSKTLNLFSTLMFQLFFHNMKYKEGLKEQTKENIIVEQQDGISRYVIPYCLALKTTICGMRGEFGIKALLDNIRNEYGFKPCVISEGHRLFPYLESVYELSPDFQDIKMAEVAYLDSDREFGVSRFKLYRTLTKDFTIQF